MLARATGRFVPTWLGGITVGVVIRMVVLGHFRWNELAFLAVALAFNGLVAWPIWKLIGRRATTGSAKAGALP